MNESNDQNKTTTDQKAPAERAKSKPALEAPNVLDLMDYIEANYPEPTPQQPR